MYILNFFLCMKSPALVITSTKFLYFIFLLIIILTEYIYIYYIIINRDSTLMTFTNKVDFKANYRHIIGFVKVLVSIRSNAYYVVYLVRN